MPRGADRWDEARVQGRLWTPAELRGNALLKGWVDIGDLNTISAASGNLSALRNKAGNATAFSVGGGTITYANYGITAALGATNFLGSTGVINTGYDLFIVAIPNATTGFRSMVQNANNHHPLVINVSTNNLGTYESAFKQAGTQTWAAGALGLCRMVYVSSTVISMSRDGNALQAVSGLVGLFGSTTPALLGSFNAAQGFGTLYEMIFTSPSLALYLYQKIEGYLAWKWSRLGRGNLVSLLPESHLHKNRPPLIGD